MINVQVYGLAYHAVLCNQYMLTVVHNIGGEPHHFSPNYLLPVKTSPLLACEKPFASGHELSPL